MGTSTDGQICFGVAFPESFEFPWDKKHDGDEEKWWRDLNGYKPPFQLYDDDQEDYVGGKKPPDSKISEYYAHGRDWDAANPMPIEIVNYCSLECPMYMIAIPSSCVDNRRGYPKEFDPSKLTVTEDQIGKLKAFIETHMKVTKEDLEYWDGDKTLTPKWYLSSYWG